MDPLEEEIGDLLEGIEGAPDEEDVDADACGNTISLETIGDWRWKEQ